MRVFPSLSDTLRRLEPRERIVVAASGAILAATLVILYAVIPFVDHWSARETAIDAKSEQLARLEGMVAREGDFSNTVAALKAERRRASNRLLHGRTTALAASRLQSILTRYAEQSRLLLGSIDLAGETETDGSLTSIPVRLSASGDIYGLVDFLAYIRDGDKLIVIDEMGVRTNPTRAGGQQLLTLTLRLHGLYSSSDEEPA